VNKYISTSQSFVLDQSTMSLFIKRTMKGRFLIISCFQDVSRVGPGSILCQSMWDWGLDKVGLEQVACISLPLSVPCHQCYTVSLTVLLNNMLQKNAYNSVSCVFMVDPVCTDLLWSSVLKNVFTLCRHTSPHGNCILTAEPGTTVD
jgi:hypothetical protein